MENHGSNIAPFKIKQIGLCLIILLSFVLIFTLIGPMSQDQAYHNFADQDSCFGVLNFHNVSSNLFFTIFSLLGFRNYLKFKEVFSISWLVFLLGVFLVAPGSAYYHLWPSDSTLVWDRIPMAMAFMGLTSVALKEVFKIQKELLLLIILEMLGVYSVFHWVLFDDLRLYLWVQLTPIVALLFISVALPNKVLKTKYLLFAVIFYIGAKLTEQFDVEILKALGYSGHSIKHILASFSVFSLILMRKKIP